MNWQFVPYTIPLIIAAAISLGLTIVAWRRRPASITTVFAWLMLVVTEWSLAYTLELGSVSRANKIFWSQVAYLGIVSVPVLWLLLTLQYTGRTKWLTRRNLYLLAIEPAVTALLVWTNDWHELIWRNIQVVQDRYGLYMWSASYGPGFWLHAGYSYLVLLSGTLLLIRGLIRAPQLYRGQAGALLVAASAPWIGNALYLSGWSPLDLAPFAFTIAGIAIAWGLFRFRLFDIVPTARDTVIENMPDGLIVLDGENRIVDLNPAAQTIIDCTPSEVIGRPAEQVLATQIGLVEQFRDLSEAQTEITLGEGTAQRHFSLHVSPLYDRRARVYPERSQGITGSLVILHDITERKRTEEMLRRQALTFENIIDSVIITDMDRLIIDCNPATEQLFGYSREEVLGRPAEIWHQAEESGMLTERILKGVERDGRWTGEIRFVHKEGRTGVCEAVVVPLYDEQGRQMATIGVSRDISERKRAEVELRAQRDAAEAASRAKSTFLANMSHELRTPLNAIIGYSELLQEEVREVGCAGFIPELENIERAGTQLLTIINDVLDLSKIEAGNMELSLGTFHVPDMIDQVIDTVRPMIEETGNQLDLRLSDDLGDMYADPDKVRQVLLNLLGNAAKFTEAGTITLAVSRETDSEGRDRFSFQVSDTGIGISSEQMLEIFQPFTQADVSTTRKYGGSGLGLSISQRFCQLMGGEITVESELGQGASFAVRLPAAVLAKQGNLQGGR